TSATIHPRDFLADMSGLHSLQQRFLCTAPVRSVENGAICDPFSEQLSHAPPIDTFAADR
ncbi:MAG: hypothetical protein ACRD1T_16750, partial [Acidimicrobiia bacterium]